MALVKHHKVVAALAAELEADSIYYVRAGSGFDVYVTNSAGTVVAYPANYARTDDTRLADAREWTASTVSQAEAEAGTATTRRAWTALRVFQAIAAWWAASAAKTKLDGIAAGATANATDAQLRDRATHTGTQAISTVSGLQTALNGKINTTERGVSGGIPTLDEFARIPPSQLPSYVDDVLEFQALANFPATGEGGKIYIAINQGTQANPTRQYRWTGSVYAEINPSPGTTDALAEGSTNLYFNESRVRSTVLTGLSLASSAAVAATDTVLAAIGKLQVQLGLKAPLDSPALTGNPTAPTPAATDNDTSIATTAHVKAAMALFGLGADAPSISNLNTLVTPGQYVASSSATGFPPGALSRAFVNVQRSAASTSYVGQTASFAIDYSGGVGMAERFSLDSGATWGAWQSIWHTGNLVKQASPTDTTPGALMAVGAGGLLGTGLLTNYNVANLLNGFYVSSAAGSPYGFDSVFMSVRGSLDRKFQIGAQITGGEKYWVTSQLNSGGTPLVRELFHTGNFDPATKQDRSAVVTTASSRTLALSDAWNYLRPGTTGAVTLTVPTNASVAFDIGTEITIRALGNITLAAASGATLNAPSGGTLSMTARMTVTLKKVGTNEWDVIGQTVAA